MSDIGDTPAASWIVNGEPDPHEGQYTGKLRKDLAMGDMTDDELANAIFMNYNIIPSVNDLISGKGVMPIAYMTAGKDRIRWLSRKLVEAEKECAILREQLANKA